MKTKSCLCLIGLFIALIPALVYGQQISLVPPEKESKLFYEFGLGIGGYFGTVGSKISIGGDLVGIDLGFGVGPLAKGVTAAFCPGISVYFKKRYETLRPKMTIFYSNIGYTINVTEKMTGGSVNVLFQQNFPGMGAIIGVNWRLGKTSKICVDAGLGYVYPFKGYTEVKRIKDEQVQYWEQQGYEIEKMLGMGTVTALDFVNFAIGVSYAIGRSPAEK